LLGAAEKFEKKKENIVFSGAMFPQIKFLLCLSWFGIETKQDEDEAVLRPEKSSMTTLCCLLGASLTG